VSGWERFAIHGGLGRPLALEQQFAEGIAARATSACIQSASNAAIACLYCAAMPKTQGQIDEPLGSS